MGLYEPTQISVASLPPHTASRARHRHRAAVARNDGACRAYGAEPNAPTVAAGALLKQTTAAPPQRLAFLYVPNGMHMPHWTPHLAGSLNDLPPLLNELAAYRDDLLVLTNLAQNHAEANGDGPGDHARSMATYLTGMQALKTPGANIRVGVSVDQVAAKQLGAATALCVARTRHRTKPPIGRVRLWL